MDEEEELKVLEVCSEEEVDEEVELSVMGLNGLISNPPRADLAC